MILADKNQSSVDLQVFALDSDGTCKLDIVSSIVRVYVVDGPTETDLLGPTEMAQVGSTNLWRYEWAPASLPVGQYVVEFDLEDGSGHETKVGEDLIVRDIATQSVLTAVQSTLTLAQSDIEIVKKIETGRWKITNDQMVFYDSDEVTPVLTFDLLDSSGSPSSASVYERLPA